MLRVSEDGGRRRGGYVEIYRQLGRTLLDLQDAADRIFDVISLRTSQEQDKLSEISRRIQVAKAKIDSLSHSEQALTVISPAQYPSTCTIEENFSPLFQYSNEGNEPGFPVAKLLVDGGLSREYGRDCTLELFQFFSEENIGYPLMESDLKVRSSLCLPTTRTTLLQVLSSIYKLLSLISLASVRSGTRKEATTPTESNSAKLDSCWCSSKEEELVDLPLQPNFGGLSGESSCWFILQFQLIGSYS